MTNVEEDCGDFLLDWYVRNHHGPPKFREDDTPIDKIDPSLPERFNVEEILRHARWTWNKSSLEVLAGRRKISPRPAIEQKVHEVKVSASVHKELEAILKTGIMVEIGTQDHRYRLVRAQCGMFLVPKSCGTLYRIIFDARNGNEHLCKVEKGALVLFSLESLLEVLKEFSKDEGVRVVWGDIRHFYY